MNKMEVINLHKLDTFYIDENDEIDETVKEEMNRVFGGEIAIEPTLEKCENLYENGVSCIDFVKYFDKNENISIEIKNTLIMNFYVFKREYRCEKLLMFHMWLSMIPNTRSSEIINII
jgi:hypothetical protein